jgi:hypothetical protein
MLSFGLVSFAIFEVDGTRSAPPHALTPQIIDASHPLDEQEKIIAECI